MILKQTFSKHRQVDESSLWEISFNFQVIPVLLHLLHLCFHVFVNNEHTLFGPLGTDIVTSALLLIS